MPTSSERVPRRGVRAPWIAVALCLAGVAPAAAQGRPPRPWPPWMRAIVDLQRRVVDLEARLAQAESPGRPLAATVDCGAGESVAARLAEASLQTAGPIAITVVGVCPEAVVIARDDVTLQGASPADGFDGASVPYSEGLIQVLGGHRIQLRDLTLANGRRAGLAAVGGSIEARGLTITDAWWGVSIRGRASLLLGDSVVRDSDRVNVTASDSSLILESTTVSGGESGVVVAGGYLILGVSTIEGSTGYGVSFHSGASAFLSGSTIRGHATGVSAVRGAAGAMVDTVVADNAGRGVEVEEGSALYLSGAADPGRIERNGGDGVVVSGGSSVHPDAVTIRDNTGSGIHLGDTSLAGSAGRWGAPSIENNGGWGVFCEAAPAVAQVQRPGYDAAGVTGNALGATNCPPLGDPARVP